MSEQTANIIWLAGIPVFALAAIVLIPYLMIRDYKADYPYRDKMSGDEFAFIALFTTMGVLASSVWFMFVPFLIIGGFAWLCYQMYLRA